MLGWIIALISAVVLLPLLGLVQGAFRNPMDDRGAVVMALVGSVFMFWIAAGVLTVRVLF